MEGPTPPRWVLFFGPARRAASQRGVPPSLKGQALTAQPVSSRWINFLKVLNSPEDAHVKDMSNFDLDEHLQQFMALAEAHSPYDET